MRVMDHKLVSQETAFSYAECSRNKPPFSFVRGQDSTIYTSLFTTKMVVHRLGLAARTQINVCKSPFPSAGTAVSLFRAKTVQQRPPLPREVETRLSNCDVTH